MAATTGAPLMAMVEMGAANECPVACPIAAVRFGPDPLATLASGRFHVTTIWCAHPFNWGRTMSGRRYITAQRLQAVQSEMTMLDRRILADVARFRLMSSRQLQAVLDIEAGQS